MSNETSNDIFNEHPNETPKIEKAHVKVPYTPEADATGEDASNAAPNATEPEKGKKGKHKKQKQNGKTGDPKKSKKKKWMLAIVAVVLVIAIVVTVVALKKRRNGEEGNQGVQVVTVEDQDMSERISVTGSVASSKAVSVTSDLTAKVKTLNVSLGDHVKKGDVLLTFDTSEINDQIKTLEQQISMAQQAKARENAKLQKALNQAVADGNAAVKEARSEADRAYQAWVAAANNPDMDDSEVQAAKEAYYAAEKAVDAAVKEGNSNVSAAQDAIEDAKFATGDNDNDNAKELAKLYRQRNNAVVKAEQDGIITMLNTSVGSTAEGILLRIEDDKSLTIQVGVEAKDIVNLRQGMRAELTTDAYPNKTFSGTVTKVVNFTSTSGGEETSSESAASSSSNAGYRANIAVDKGDGLLLGMHVKVKIYLKEGEAGMAVPYDSIFEEDGTSYVYKAVPSETDMEKAVFKKVRVNPEQKSSYYTKVASEDLSVGDLVVSDPYSVSEGSSDNYYISDREDIPIADTNGEGAEA